jgi:hypothetical protein
MGCRTVTVAGPPPNRLPIANFESLTAVGSTVTLFGWGLDQDTPGPIDIHFYVNGGWGGAVTTGLTRLDVGRAYPGAGDLTGFSRSFTAGPGTHQICAYAIDTTTKANTPMGCRTVTVAGPPPNRLPVANFESLSPVASGAMLFGWALDPDAPGPVDVHFYVNGTWGGSVTTGGVTRPDVGAAYPGAGNLTGFSATFSAGPGTHQVCAYAIDSTTRANTPMGCRTVTIAGPPPPRLPLANFESLTVSGSTVTLAGWALDLDTPGPVDVHYYVNGAWGGSVTTDVLRTDVARWYLGTGMRQGFSRSFSAGPGTHQVCAYAIDTTTKANSTMGCRTVTVG